MPSEEINLIDLEALGRFGIGAKTNALYFDGQRVHTDAVIGLTKFQKLIALSVSVATIVAALATVVYSGTYVYDTLLRPEALARGRPAAAQPQPFAPPEIILPASMTTRR